MKSQSNVTREVVTSLPVRLKISDDIKRACTKHCMVRRVIAVRLLIAMKSSEGKIIFYVI
jgi:hypothetical protein